MKTRLVFIVLQSEQPRFVLRAIVTYSIGCDMQVMDWYHILAQSENQVNKYSRTSPYGHLSNTDTSLLRAISYVPTKF